MATEAERIAATVREFRLRPDHPSGRVWVGDRTISPAEALEIARELIHLATPRSDRHPVRVVRTLVHDFDTVEHRDLDMRHAEMMRTNGDPDAVESLYFPLGQNKQIHHTYADHGEHRP